MIVCWCAPVRLWTSTTREWVLMWLDILGKYSLLDTFVMIMMMIAFRFHLLLPETGFLKETAAIDIIVLGEWGIYGFVIATVISLTLTHIILAMHRHAENPDPKISQEGGQISLCRYDMQIQSESYRFSWIGRHSISFMLIMSTCLLVWGITVPSFTFTFKGLISLPMNLTGESTYTAYSVLSLGQSLPGVSQGSNVYGVRMLQSVYYFISIVAPLTQMLVLFALWNMTLKVPHPPSPLPSHPFHTRSSHASIIK